MSDRICHCNGCQYQRVIPAQEKPPAMPADIYLCFGKPRSMVEPRQIKRTWKINKEGPTVGISFEGKIRLIYQCNANDVKGYFWYPSNGRQGKKALGFCHTIPLPVTLFLP